MSQKDLFVEVAQPVGAQVEVTCRQCHHFKDVPYYSVDGKMTVCSHERIGRRPNQLPCPNFAVNMSILKHMTPKATELLVQLLAELELDFSDDKTKAQKGRDLQSLTHLSLVLRALHNARRSGFELGADYEIEGRNIEGKLVSLGKVHGTIKTSNGISYTVEHSQLSRA